MNKTPIEWTDFTWNPVTGCFHRCRSEYCYNTVKSTSPLNRFGARFFDASGQKVSAKDWKSRETGGLHTARKGEVYPFGYDPTFYPHRLFEPTKVKGPHRIFTVDTGDLFGQWVPEEWIGAVMEVIARCPQHTFQILTKNPGRLVGRRLPKNVWAGTSVSSSGDVARVDALRKVAAQVRFLSIEPLLGPVEFGLHDLEWVIVGAQTGKGAKGPARSWVDHLVASSADAGVPLFLKDNLRPHYPHSFRAFPGVCSTN